MTHLSSSCPVPLDARSAGLHAPPPGQPAAGRSDDNEFLQPAAPVDDSWVELAVRESERETVERRRRPLYREGLLRPVARPVFRCAECDLKIAGDERDCPRCGSDQHDEDTGPMREFREALNGPKARKADR